MNIFESLIEELKEENLLETTVTEDIGQDPDTVSLSQSQIEADEIKTETEPEIETGLMVEGAPVQAANQITSDDKEIEENQAAENTVEKTANESVETIIGDGLPEIEKANDIPIKDFELTKGFNFKKNDNEPLTTQVESKDFYFQRARRSRLARIGRISDGCHRARDFKNRTEAVRFT